MAWMCCQAVTIACAQGQVAVIFRVLRRPPAIALDICGSWARDSAIASLTIIGVFTPVECMLFTPDDVRGEDVGVGTHEPDDIVLAGGITEAAAGRAADAGDASGRAGQQDRAPPAALDH